MKGFREKLNNINKSLELPDGLLCGGTRIELQSDRYAIIDGKCAILLLSDTEIRLNTGSGKVCFVGANLAISTLDKAGASISGNIKSLSFG